MSMNGRSQNFFRTFRKSQILLPVDMHGMLPHASGAHQPGWHVAITSHEGCYSAPSTIRNTDTLRISASTSGRSSSKDGLTTASRCGDSGDRR